MKLDMDEILRREKRSRLFENRQKTSREFFKKLHEFEKRARKTSILVGNTKT
jgi:hypothetical protein